MLHTFLSQCDSVVLQEDDFETVSNHRVVVDHLADGCDETDDHLGSVVPRGSLEADRHRTVGRIKHESRGWVCGRMGC